MGKKYKVGDCWEVTKEGVTYLMQKQPKGRAKAIKRLTPYVCQNKANGRANSILVPKNAKKPVTVKRSGIAGQNWIRDIKPNKEIKPSEPFNPEIHISEVSGYNAYGRANTWVIKKKSA